MFVWNHGRTQTWPGNCASFSDPVGKGHISGGPTHFILAIDDGCG